MSILEQATTRKRQVDENATELAKLDANDNKDTEYKLEAICDSAVYTKESKSGYLLRLYNLVSCKDYLEEENT